MLRDSVTQIKKKVDDTLDICGAALVPKDYLESGIAGLGEEDFLVIFRLLMFSLRVPLEMDVEGLDLSGIDSLNSQIAEQIQERANVKTKKNKKNPQKELHTYNSLF